MATMHVAKLPPHCMRVQPDDTGRPVSYHTTSGRELEMEFRDEADEEPKPMTEPSCIDTLKHSLDSSCFALPLYVLLMFVLAAFVIPTHPHQWEVIHPTMKEFVTSPF